MINQGITFGLIPGISPWIIFIVLVALSIYALKMRELWGRLGLFLIILGGGGNLISRLRYGGVRDNLVLLGLIHNNGWDYLIVIGVVIYAIFVVRRKH
jgi:lipoprotein signal peptidase